MFPSPSSSQNADGTLLRRMLIESTGLGLQQQLKQRQQDVNEYAVTEQGIMDSRRIDPTDNQLEDVPGHGRMGGSSGGYSWDSVIADAMLSMTASPLVHHSRGRHDVGLAGANALGTDYDSDAGGHELSLSPRGLDDDVNEDDDDQNDMLGLSMDQDSSDQSGSSGSSEHHPRKKGRPSKFGLSGLGPHSGVECPVCNKLFNNSSALAKHKLTHSTERKYACRICSKTFKRQDHLNGHMLTHSSKKPFECRYPSCGRSYCDARSLRRHHDNYHSRPGSSASLPIGADSLVGSTSGNSNQSPFSAVSLAQSDGGLQIGSELVPSGSYDSELQFECELCFRRFKNLPALNGHMRLHGGYFKKDGPSATSDASRSASRSESKPCASPDSQPAAEGTFIPAARSQSSSVDVTSQWISSNLLLPSGHIVGTTYADILPSAAAVQGAAASSALSHAGSTILPLNVVAGDMSGLLGLAAAQSQAAAAAASGGLLSGSLVSGPLGLFRLSNNLLLPVDNLNTANLNLLSGLSRATAADGNENVMVADATSIRSGNIAPAGGAVEHKTLEGGRDRAVQETNASQMDSLYQSLLCMSDRNSIGNSQDADSAHRNASLDLPNISKQIPSTESHFRFLTAPASSNFPAIHQLLQQNQAASSQERSDTKPDPKYDPNVPLHVNTDNTVSDTQYLNRRRWTSADADVLRRPRRWDLIEDMNPAILGRQESVGFELTEGLYTSALPFDEPEVGSPSAADADIDEEKANFSGEFSAPAGMGLHHKFRRKHRPEPLIIPSPVTGTHFAFQSRLRSPRICDHPGSLMPAASAVPIKAIVSSSSFTPYTPPPMLSPLRTGSGLFCSLVEPSPKSAPVGFRLGLFHRNSLSMSTNTAQAPTAASIIEEEEEEEVEEQILDVPHIETEEVIHEIDLEPPPQTDILPHINVGPEYQADIPDFCHNRQGAFSAPDWSDVVWDPALMMYVSEEDVRHLMDFACCAAVHGSGANKEYAHHLLYLCKGNVKLAALKLMKLEPSLPKDHTLHSYVYQETSVWNAEEIEAYQNAMMKFDKDFFRVAQQVGTKSVRECTAFYWLWKKVCVEEWRRMRILRRKRIQDSMYHLRSSDQDAAKSFGNEAEFIGDASDQKGIDYLDDVGDASGTEGMNSQPPSPRRQVEQCVAVERPVQVIQQQPPQPKHHHHQQQVQQRQVPQPPPKQQQQQQQQQQQPQQLFPCRICGKVFDRVKSRSAHMKSHRQIEPDTHHHRSTLPFNDVYR